MRYPLSIIYTHFLLLTSTSNSFAETLQNSIELPRLVINNPKSQLAPPILTIQHDSIIDSDQLAHDKVVDLNAPLYKSPGIVLTQGKTSGVTGITIRGASGGQGLLSLDGVPLFANFAGFYSLRLFPSHLLDKVQINRGFDPSLNASRTLGGSIQMYSRRMIQGDSEFQLEGGSQATVNTHVATGLGDPQQNLSLLLGYQHIAEGQTQSGVPSNNTDRDNYRLGHALLRGEQTFARGQIQASFYYANADEDADGPGFTPDFKIAWLEDPDGWFSEQLIVAQTQATLELTPDWQTQLQLAYTGDQQDGELGSLRPYQPIGPFSMNLHSELWQIDWKNRHRLTWGQAFETQIQWGLLTQHQKAHTEQNHQTDQRLLLSPQFALAMHNSDWDMQFKMQWDHYEQEQSELSFTAGVDWQILPSFNLWANGGHRFRTPGLNERLHPLFGNPNLKAERNFGGELGLTWQYHATEITLSSYWQRADDLIVLALDSNTGSSRAQNIPDVETYGIDASLKQMWFDTHQTQLNYSYMHAQNKQTGQTIAARPEHRISLTHDWQILPALNWQVTVNAHTGLWLDSNNQLESGSIIRLNSLLNYQVNDQYELYVRAENLTDNQRTELAGFNYPHRAYYMGVKLKF